jgi:heme-degrading monooxygenase HmoA
MMVRIIEYIKPVAGLEREAEDYIRGWEKIMKGCPGFIRFEFFDIYEFKDPLNGEKTPWMVSHDWENRDANFEFLATDEGKKILMEYQRVIALHWHTHNELRHAT